MFFYSYHKESWLGNDSAKELSRELRVLTGLYDVGLTGLYDVGYKVMSGFGGLFTARGYLGAIGQ